MVAVDKEQQLRLIGRTERAVKRLFGYENPPGIAAFNDAKDTTQEDVLLAVRYAEEEGG